MITTLNINKRKRMKVFKIAVAFVALLATSSLLAQDKMERLVLAGPKAPVTPPLAYIVDRGLLNDVAKKVDLIIWKNPDQLRSLIIGKQVDITATPSQMAAKLYNKGIKLKLLNISVWGDYWIVSNNPDVKNIEDLKGQEIAMPGRGGTPNTVFTLLVKKLNLDIKKDFSIKFMPNFIATLQEVSSGRVDYAFLSEPHASLALMKTKGTKNQLYKSVDISKEWGKLYDTSPRISRAGMSALPGILKSRPDVVEKFQVAYEKAVDWCNKNPEEAGKLAEKYIPGFKAEAVTMSLKTGTVEFVNAVDAKKDIEMFYNALLKSNPKKIGGKLPSDEMYYR